MIMPSEKPDLSADKRRVVRYSSAPVPTHLGQVEVVVYREIVNGLPSDQHEHLAILIGDPGTERVLSRVHSECLTSEVFGSLKCDCRDQLDAALEAMHEDGNGVFLYLRQEGRGIGLGNKIKAYALQAQGADTIEANHELGFETDLRTYDIAAGMLHDLGVESVRLMTNNPDKIQGLIDSGIDVTERVPIQLEANRHSAGYFETKRASLGHLLEPVRLF